LTALAGALARRPRAPVGIFPTPLQRMRRLSRYFGRPVYFKRDDLAGLAMGGSKIRILQFTAGEALAGGADTFVAGGYVQSNHPAQVAAAGAALGVPTHVILDVTKGYEPQGNLLLLDLAGARVQFSRAGYDGVLAQCRRLAARLERAGRRPRVMTQTRESRILSAVAYADGFVELHRQLEALGIREADIVVGSGGPTYAGLLLGAIAGGSRCRVHGVPPRGRGADAREQIRAFIAEACALLEVEVMAGTDGVSFLGDGPGVYGEVGRETVAAIRFVAAQEGVYLDPVYGGHAMAALLRRERRTATDRPLVFVQTGGAPTVFAYERELASRRVLDYASLAPRVNRAASSVRRVDRAAPKRRRPGRQHARREVHG
jgi:1-aminocyclopropane-1-carboxylate deaminase/D-cysteine desulfhydrase-like pyridoxal-dependent ACC family enzyme